MSNPIYFPPSLTYFTIYNPSLKSQGEDIESFARQIYFFYPSSTKLEQQVKEIGACQAMYQFSQGFPEWNENVASGHSSQSQGLEQQQSQQQRNLRVVKTKKARICMLEVEKDCWIVAKARVGMNVKVAPNGKKLAEYLDDEFQSETLIHFVEHLYRRFKLIHGSFQQVLERFNTPTSWNEFRDEITSFFVPHLQNRTFEHADLTSRLNGIQYTPVSRDVYLKIVVFVKELQDKLRPLSLNILILWKHTLLWNGFGSLNDTSSLYEYLIDPETGKVADGIINQVKPKGQALIDSKRLNVLNPTVSQTSAKSKTKDPNSLFSGYIVGPDQTDQGSITPRFVYLGRDSIPHALIVYQFRNDVTIAVAIPYDSNKYQSEGLDKPSFYKEFEDMMTVSFTTLYHPLRDEWKHVERKQSMFKYFRFSRRTFAVDSSILWKDGTFQREWGKILGLIHEQLFEDTRAITARLGSTDFWIAYCRIHEEDAYLLISKKDATPLDIQDHIDLFRKATIQGLLDEQGVSKE